MTDDPNLQRDAMFGRMARALPSNPRGQMVRDALLQTAKVVESENQHDPSVIRLRELAEHADDATLALLGRILR